MYLLLYFNADSISTKAFTVRVNRYILWRSGTVTFSYNDWKKEDWHESRFRKPTVVSLNLIVYGKEFGFVSFIFR